jgi:hypothetical protein
MKPCSSTCAHPHGLSVGSRDAFPGPWREVNLFKARGTVAVFRSRAGNTPTARFGNSSEKSCYCSRILIVDTGVLSLQVRARLVSAPLPVGCKLRPFTEQAIIPIRLQPTVAFSNSEMMAVLPIRVTCARSRK